MEQRISIVTLGVADVSRARTFYERLGWRGQEMEETVFFQAGTMAVILWGRAKLAEDSGVPDSGAVGFDGVVLAHNLRSRAEVDALLADASRSTTALMPQSWSPAGSSKICRITHCPGWASASIISRAGPRASDPVPISSCTSK